MPLIVPGLTTGGASTPDHASLAVTDLDVRIRLSMAPWAAIFLSAHLIGQSPQDGTPNNGWVLSIHPNQRPRLAVYTDGTNFLTPSEATAALTYPADIVPHWLRATFDADTGAGQYAIDYYTSEDGSTWTPLGTQLTGTSLGGPFNSTAPLRLPANTLGYIGRVYYAEVRSSIGGTIVADPDFSAQAPGTTSFNDSTGKTWTVSGLEINSGILPQQIGLLA